MTKIYTSRVEGDEVVFSPIQKTTELLTEAVPEKRYKIPEGSYATKYKGFHFLVLTFGSQDGTEATSVQPVTENDANKFSFTEFRNLPDYVKDYVELAYSFVAKSIGRDALVLMIDHEAIARAREHMATLKDVDEWGFLAPIVTIIRRMLNERKEPAVA